MLVYLPYIFFSIVTKRLQPTDLVRDGDVWDMYGCAIGYIFDILIHMFVLVIENFNMFWKGQRDICDFRIILVFSSLYYNTF